MAQFRIRIAGAVAQVVSVFDSTRDYCAKYLTEDPPEYFVQISSENLEFEQKQLYLEALEEGLRPRVFTEPFLDRAAVQRAVAENLISRDILMIHGSLVSVDGEGYLFMAKKCGTGKSTHTRLWREVFGDRAVMVNDDKPFLAVSDEGVTGFGAPWSGKHGLDANMAVKLRGICLLERGEINQIVPVSAEELRDLVKKESFCPPGREDLRDALIDKILARVPVWKMVCNREKEAAQVAYGAMAGLAFREGI